MKFKLFEFEDLPWFPDPIRDGMTDLLRYVFNTVNFYEPVTAIINEGLIGTGQNRIIDLCSGAGGGIEKVYHNLRLIRKHDLSIILTDKFPNLKAYQYLKNKTDGKIDYIRYPVDAMKVPVSIEGLRVMFSGFHHFKVPEAKQVLKDAVTANQGIAIFDGGDNDIFIILAILLIMPVAIVLVTPFIKPFRFSRLFFTYLLPIIPLCTVWDGLVSVSWLYRPDELLAMANEAETVNYIWKAGKQKNKMGIDVAYLLGYPQK